MVEEKLRRKHTALQEDALTKDSNKQEFRTGRNRSRGSSNSNRSSTEAANSSLSVSPASTNMKGSLTSQLLASLDKENAQLRSASAESHDSISSEMCHFKPISAAPRTPPKRLPDGRFEEPEVVHTKARRVDFSSDLQCSKVLSIKIQAIMVDTQNKTDGEVALHSGGTPFTSKKLNCSRKPNIDLSFKENYPFYSGSGSQSLSPTKSFLTGSNQNGTAATKATRSNRVNKPNHKLSEGCGEESLAAQRKRKAEDKAQQRKITKAGECNETDASTSDTQPPSTNFDKSTEALWAELEQAALERIAQEENDRQLAIQLQEEFNRSLNRGDSLGSGKQYFLRSQKKK